MKRRQAEFGEEGLVAWTMLARQRPAKMERLVSRTGSEAPSEAQEAPASRITVLHFNDVYNVEPRPGVAAGRGHLGTVKPPRRLGARTAPRLWWQHNTEFDVNGLR